MSIHKTATAKGFSWTVRWRDPRPRQKTFRTKVEAERFERSIRHRMDAGTYRDPKMDQVTFRDWHGRWWPTVVATRAPNTIAQYESLLRLHVLPHLGDLRLAAIRRIDLEEWIAALRIEGLGASAVRVAKILAGAVLASAVDSGVIPANPAAGVRVPKGSGRTRQALTVRQVTALGEAADEHWRPLLLVLAYGGLRPGEALALRRRHLDHLGQLLVEEGVSEVRGHLVRGDTKTHRVRIVPLPEQVVRELRRHLDAELDAGPDDPMFRTALGKPVRLSNFRRNVFEPAVRAAGLPDWVTPYTLRHTCASLLAQRGVPPSTAAAMLGHDPAVYLRTYAHLYPGDLRAAADALGAAIDDDQKPALEPIELDRARGFRGGTGVSGR